MFQVFNQNNTVFNETEETIKEIDIIRQEAFIDIDRCIIHILKNTLEYLQETTIDIDYMTQMTYNYYVNEKEKVYNKIGADYGF